MRLKLLEPKSREIGRFVLQVPINFFGSCVLFSFQPHRLRCFFFYLFQSFQQREAFIATQAPLDTTVVDFWRMTWEYEANCIVMLCTQNEREEVWELIFVLSLISNWVQFLLNVSFIFCWRATWLQSRLLFNFQLSVCLFVCLFVCLIYLICCIHLSFSGNLCILFASQRGVHCLWFVDDRD